MKIKHLYESPVFDKHLHNSKYLNSIKESLKSEIKDPLVVSQVLHLYEASITRATQWIEKYDIATITAFRKKLTNIMDGHESKTYMKIADKNGQRIKIEDGYVFTNAEKYRRNRMLKLMLLQKGYGVTNIQGNWIEGFKGDEPFDVTEESLFVVNLNNDPDFVNTLFRFSEFFNQDTFLYKLKNDDAYLKGTNKDTFVGYNKIKYEGQLTFLPSKFMSRIRNAAMAFVNKQKWNKCNTRQSADPKDVFSTDYSLSWWKDDQRPFPPLSYQKAHPEKYPEKFNEALLEDWYNLVNDNGVKLMEKPYGYARIGLDELCGKVIGDDFIW